GGQPLPVASVTPKYCIVILAFSRPFRPVSHRPPRPYRTKNERGTRIDNPAVSESAKAAFSICRPRYDRRWPRPWAGSTAAFSGLLSKRVVRLPPDEASKKWERVRAHRLAASRRASSPSAIVEM